MIYAWLATKTGARKGCGDVARSRKLKVEELSREHLERLAKIAGPHSAAALTLKAAAGVGEGVELIFVRAGRNIYAFDRAGLTTAKEGEA